MNSEWKLRLTKQVIFSQEFSIASKALKVIMRCLFGVLVRMSILLFGYNYFCNRQLYESHNQSTESCNKIMLVCVISYR